jgi:hypothetical protein
VRAFDAPGSSTASRLLNISRSRRLQLLFIYVSFIIASCPWYAAMAVIVATEN